MARPLFTATFWLDTLERTVRTFAQTVLALLGLMATPEFEWSWLLAGITVGIPTVSAVLFAIIASGIGEPGTASLLNPAPPDTLRDNGGATVQLVILIVVVIFAFFGAAHIFGWNLG